MTDSGVSQISAGQLTTETQAPVEILLQDKSLRVLEWLRILPGKRLVGHAQLHGRDVLVKFFLSRRATVKAELELDGIKCLELAALPSPALLEHKVSGDLQIAWVITEYIPNAQNLAQLADIDIEHSVIERPPPECLNEAARLVARLHNNQLIQSDIHPRNLLFSSNTNKWLLIDAAEIAEIITGDVSAKIRNNLALYLAQFPDHWRQAIIRAYQQVAQFSFDIDTLIKEANHWKLWRARMFAEKSLRDATQFKISKDFGHFYTSWRRIFEQFNLSSTQFDTLIADALMLKDGGSATLVRLEIDNHPVVLKRYNLKNLWHWLRRVFRPSRAWHSWKVGHQLRVLGIRTPKPLAMLEKRWGFLRREAYLVTEFCKGAELQSLIKGSSVEDMQPIIAALQNLLTLMQRYRIAHGDFKARNFIWNGQLNVIDLDAVQFFSNERQWRKAYNKDLDRLVRNWPEDSSGRVAILELVNKFR